MSFLNNFFARYKKDQGISSLALCWLAYAISYLSRSNMAISLVSLKDKYAFSLPQVSLLGTLFFVAYAVGQLINGRLGDITTPRRMITAGLLVAAVCNILFGALSSYPALAALWTINGFALSALWGPITRMMAHYFKGHKRNTVSMLMMTSPAVGCLVSWGAVQQNYLQMELSGSVHRHGNFDIRIWHCLFAFGSDAAVRYGTGGWKGRDHSPVGHKENHSRDIHMHMHWVH